VLGTIDKYTPSAGAVEMTSTVVYKHEQYNPSTIANDIALIKLPSNVTYTSNQEFAFFEVVIILFLDNIKPIALPPLADATNTFEGPAVASGFGAIFNISGSATIRQLKYKVTKVLLQDY
jgi:hypothetical protein